MAQLVGAFASSHAPLIARDWEILPPEAKQKISSGFSEMKSRIKELCPDLLIMLAPDHWVNFFLDNLRAFVSASDQNTEDLGSHFYLRSSNIKK